VLEVDGLDTALDAIDRYLGCDSPPPVEDWFAASFLAQIPAPSLQRILTGMVEQMGPCTQHCIVERSSPHSAKVRWTFARGYTVEGSIGVAEPPAAKVLFLNFGLPTRREDSWGEIESDVGALPGRTSFEIRELGEGRRFASHQPSQKLCVGSTSKLVILSALLDEIAAGRRSWEEILHLEERHRSAPSGILGDWPPGSPLTLHSAAVLLISLSDNSAADLLLETLGRDAVEGTLGSIGIGDHPSLHPFLSTREVFHLALAAPDLRGRYLASGREERLGLLQGSSQEPLDLARLSTEVWDEGMGWYLSASEVCSLLARLRDQVCTDPVSRGVLGSGRSKIASDRWPFVGYKGGSSPGRLCLAVLLRREDERWFAVSLIVAAPPASLQIERCAALVRRSTELLLTASG
jgi:hypothetical protein